VKVWNIAMSRAFAECVNGEIGLAAAVVRSRLGVADFIFR
jgi:hypothetical protein